MLDDAGFDIGELEDLLVSFSEGDWEVERTLSSSPLETTQLVRRKNAAVDAPFVRKLFAPESGLGEAYCRVFAAQLAGRRFKHLPLIYDASRLESGLAIVMEYVRGDTLEEAVGKGRPVGGALAQSVGSALCDAMTELHTCFDTPIVHRDLKPANIMVDGDALVLLDLGIARSWRESGVRNTIRLGTPGYAPPEQFGYGQTTPASDIYAAGMVLAFCLTGENPTPALRESGFSDERISPAWRTVLTKATAIDAAQRYADAEEMKRDILRASGLSAGASRWQNDAARKVVSQAEPRTAPADAHAAPVAAHVPDGSRYRERGPEPFSTVGLVWNVFVVLFWLLLIFICLGSSFYPNEETLTGASLEWRLVSYLGVIVIPAGFIGYLLLDKRRLRRRFHVLSGLSWKVEVPVCLLLAVFIMTCASVLVRAAVG